MLLQLSINTQWKTPTLGKKTYPLQVYFSTLRAANVQVLAALVVEMQSNLFVQVSTTYDVQINFSTELIYKYDYSCLHKHYISEVILIQ